jgi:hypothetical protein
MHEHDDGIRIRVKRSINKDKRTERIYLFAFLCIMYIFESHGLVCTWFLLLPFSFSSYFNSYPEFR